MRWDLPLAGLPYMLMMKGGQRLSIVGIYQGKKEAVNEQLMAE